jgi:glycosyltransferase involved in cell wall biosynthesis
MRVHFVVPYYLDPRYLFELVDSVRKQTRDDWLLTIVDDCYPGTAAEDYVRELGDPRIRYRRNERNLGVIANVVQCLTMGEAETIVVMGADDAVEPNYVDVVLTAFARHPDAIMVHPGIVLVDGDGNPTDSLADKIKRLASRASRRRGELDGPTAIRSLMMGNWLYVPAMCFRQDVIGRARDLGDYGSIGDLAWVVDMLLEGGTLVMDPTPAFRYRRHQASHSSVHARSVIRFDEEQRFYAIAARRLRDIGWRRAARMARLHPLSRLHAMQMAINSFLHGNPRLGAALVRRSLRPV